MTSVSSNEVVLIPLNKLRMSALNVRKKEVGEGYRKQLKASILAQGLLKNLIVAPSEDKAGVYEVGGGGNRYHVLQELRDEKSIKGDFQVPCVIKSQAEITALSLSENIHEPMHPADEFEAYKKMADSGKSIKEIAQSFGHSTNQVKKLLKLGAVAPVIIDKFREGSLGLDIVMAFAVSDDHEEQLDVLASLKGYRLSAHNVRQALIGADIKSTDAIVKFVGLKNYQKAGGTSTTDLFQSVTYLHDEALIGSLAKDALEKQAEKLKGEGWLWVLPSLKGWEESHKYSNLSADYKDVPNEVSAALNEARSALEALDAMDADDMSEEDYDRYGTLEAAIDRIEEKMEDYRAYTLEQKAVAGCIVSFNDEGEYLLFRGLQRKEDIKRSSVCSEQFGTEDVGDSSLSEQNEYSAALRVDLDQYYKQSFRAALAKNEDLAFDLLIYQLCVSALSDAYDRVLDIQINTTSLSAIGIDAIKATQTLNEVKAQCKTDWFEVEDDAQRFLRFQQLSKKDKQRLMALAVAHLASPSPRSDGALAIAKDQLKLNVSHYYQPTKETFFGRVSKGALLSIGAGVMGESFAKEQANSKKGELAEYMANLPEFSGWVPDYLKA